MHNSKLKISENLSHGFTSYELTNSTNFYLILNMFTLSNFISKLFFKLPTIAIVA